MPLEAIKTKRGIGMDESILTTIKSMLNIDSNITDFDSDLIVLINSSLSTLFQLGIGEGKPFRISGSSETWSQLLTKEYYLELVKETIYLDVRIVFDPPSSSIVMETMKEIRKENQWRIAAQVDMANLPIDEDDTTTTKLDYNDLKNKPSLNDIELKGDVQMDIAGKKYVDEKVGEIEDGYY